MTDKDKVLKLFQNSKKVWTLTDVARAIDCSHQRTKAILLNLEGDGNIVRININNSILYTDNAVNIDWITDKEYFLTLPLKEKILWIITNRIEEWWYN